MANLPEGEKRIDTHGFLGKSTVFAVPHTTASYFKRSEFSDTSFLIIPFEASRNAPTLKKIGQDPKFLGMYLMFNPNEELHFWTRADGVENIAKLMNERYVVGLKSLPSYYKVRMNDPRYFPYYEVAEQHSMPILLHAASSGQDFNSAEMTREVLDRFPDLKIILAHFGGLRPEYMAGAVKLAQEYSRLYLNTTTMHQMGRQSQTSNVDHSRRVIETGESEIEAMRRDAFDIFVGLCRTRPQQILYGSDLGYNPPEEYSLWPVDQVEQSLAHEIFIENPRRVFGILMKQEEDL